MQTTGLGLVVVLCLASAVRLPHDGPHGGELFQGAGHKYHAELCQDTKKQTIKVYILDGQARKSVPIAAKSIELRLKGQTDGIKLDAVVAAGASKSAEFSSKHSNFAKALKISEVTLVIKLDDGKEHVFVPEHDHD